MTELEVERRALGALLFAAAALPASAQAQPSNVWVTSWAASVQGPYPVGNPSAQPNQSFAFPSADRGATNQSLRLIARPTVWGRQVRLRFSNAFGTRPLTLDGVFVGLQLGGAAVMPGTNQPVRFGNSPSATIPPGGDLWSDAVELPFANDPASPLLAGRKLAVSFHIAGESGPMTWHAKALQTSYVTAPEAGARGQEDGEAAFPHPTASWFFLDAMDMMMPAGTPVVACFGDSITDGTASTMNGDDRWPDVFQRRLHQAFPNRVAVVNAGIGGNQVAGPAEYSPARPFPGGPASLQRLERDVINLSGVSHFVWLEGINDFSRNGNASIEAVTDGMRRGVAMLRERRPGIRVIGATVTTALGSSSAAHGFPEQDEKRRALNDFIRSSGVFDAVFDFDRAVLDRATGGMRAEFVPDSTTGGPGDKLHPNRAGYVAMAMAAEPAALLPSLR
jgi:lysophospholipase L1-like esterase